MTQILPSQIAKDVGALISDLQAKGWTISFARYDAQSFGNWYVDLCQVDDCIRLTKDRSQYMFDGPPAAEIKTAGLWKAFDDREEFCQAVSTWAFHD
jgi:hypothetical protein